MTKKMIERIKMVKCMEFIMRNVNDETIIDSWLTCGVADGDIEYGDLYDDPSGIEFWVEDNENFAELMELFLRCMARAKEDGLYCDGVLSK